MLGTCREIIRRDVADISANLAGNLIGFIVSMVCCVLVFLCIQNNLDTTNTHTDGSPKKPVTSLYNHAPEDIPVPSALSMVSPFEEEGFCLCDMFSFPLVTDVRNNSFFQEQRGLIIHPMIKRQLDKQNQSTQPEHSDQIDCPTKPRQDVSKIDYGRINHHVKYKPLSKFRTS